MAAVSQFVAGLKSRNRDLQNKAAQDLFLYVKTELREMPQDELIQFFDDFNHHIFDMVSSPDANEKKGGVLAISKKRKIRPRNLFLIHVLFFRVSNQRRCRQHDHPHFAVLEQLTQPAAFK